MQSLTGKYWSLQGNLCNENRVPAMRTGVPCNENRFFPVRIALQGLGLHKGTIWQFPVQWIYYCHSHKSTGKKTGKTHLWSFLFEKIDGMMR
jgi:hypothetical protein